MNRWGKPRQNQPAIENGPAATTTSTIRYLLMSIQRSDVTLTKILR